MYSQDVPSGRGSGGGRAAAVRPRTPHGGRRVAVLLLALVLGVGMLPGGCRAQLMGAPSDQAARAVGAAPARPGEPPGFVAALTAAALERTTRAVRYDGSYRAIPFPGGDVPEDTGVCTDVVIRAYRTLGIDLQLEVNREMTADFAAFPGHWNLDRPDPNIDHRRVPNLRVFFSRRGEALPITDDPADYFPGDLVTWDVWGRPHIGIVVGRRALGDASRFMVVHNIGRGPRLEDILFAYPITGHYRYYGDFDGKPAAAGDGGEEAPATG